MSRGNLSRGNAGADLRNGSRAACRLRVGAGFLARRNLRIGRGDGRTALRLGIAGVVCARLAWVFGIHHVRDRLVVISILPRDINV